MTATHLMVEGVLGTRHTERELVDFIRKVASSDPGINMKIIMGPMICAAADHRVAYAIIAESHIIINEFDDRRFTMDVFSCKSFERTIPVDLAMKILDLQPGYIMRILFRAGVE